MNIKEQIRAEIERRRLHFNKEAKKYQALNNGYSQNCYGARDALRDLENFLDTLPEQPVEGLEAEVDEYVKKQWDMLTSTDSTKSIVRRTARHFAEWGARHAKQLSDEQEKDK